MSSVDRDVLDAHALWLESSGREGRQLVLPAVDLRGADLSGENLARANLVGAMLDGVVLVGANLEAASMAGCSLVGTYLQRTCLRSVDLAGANLSGADLYHAELRSACLTDAVLRQSWCLTTRFDGADLTGADLSRAYLGKASLRSVCLDGSVLAEADVMISCIDGSRFDVTSVAGLVGAIGPADDHVTVVGDGTVREVTVGELVEVLGRRSAQVSTWGAGQRVPSLTPWRWDPQRRKEEPGGFDDLRAQFSPDEIRLLDDCRPSSVDGLEQADALSLAFDWTTQVARLDGERTMSMHDRYVRTEDDLAGLLFTRDRAAAALAVLPANLRAKVEQFISAGDERFLSITVEDSRAQMAAVAEIDPAGRSWWWFRLPFDGPVAGFLRSRFESGHPGGLSK